MDLLIPSGIVREIFERWIAENFDNAEAAYQFLSSNSELQADSWRRRLTPGVSKNRGSTYVRGWWTMEALDPLDVDELLTAAGLTHLWHLPPLSAYTTDGAPEPGDCLTCGAWIPPSATGGVRYLLEDLSWTVCIECLIGAGPPIFGAGTTRLSVQTVTKLYRRYLSTGESVMMIGATEYERYGFRSANSMAQGLRVTWSSWGWPLRDRSEGRVSARKIRVQTQVGKIPTKELRALHRLHTGKMVSINNLARQTYERYGYKTAGSCASSISLGWKQLGLEAIDRIAMTVHVSTKDGNSPRDWKLRKKRRKEAGLTQHGNERNPICVGTTRRGRCTRPAVGGSIYCQSHEPELQAVLQARLAEMRRRSPVLNRPMTDPAPVLEEVEAWAAWYGKGADRELAKGLGRSPGAIADLRNVVRDGRPISVERAAKIRAVIEELARRAPIGEDDLVH